jgi:hypothetical protein
MKAQLLGESFFSKENFKDVEKSLKECRSSIFQQFSDQEKYERVSRILCDLIQKTDDEDFLLPAALDFIDRINQEKILENYLFTHFELWLNQFSGLSFEDNLTIRGKIVGRRVPREDYQGLFPVAMGKVYPGSHFVTAHGSPDLDTTIASFWGWVDAFGARVSEGLHIWNVPGGVPESQAEIALLFHSVFGENVFSYLTKTRTSLTVSGFDLLTQSGLLKKESSQLTLGIDLEKERNAVIIVDDEQYYLGEWRNIDAERVRFVIDLLNQCLRWYENYLNVKLVAFFVKPVVTRQELVHFMGSIFNMKIKECAPAAELTHQQTQLLQDYLIKVLGASKGIDSSFAEFAAALETLAVFDLQQFISTLKSFENLPLFDKAGKLVEDRSQIFNFLVKAIEGLDQAIHSVRVYVERLDVAHHVKTSVLGLMPQYVNYRADLEEIRSKLNGFPYLTVTGTGKEGKLFPLGVVHAAEVQRPILGTVSLRDFSNREETKIPAYLEIISVIDHHKSSLVNTTPSVITIADVQSCNVLVAEKSFEINDKHSLGGMTLEQIEKQLQVVQKDLKAPSQKRVLQRLLQRYIVAAGSSDYSISPKRERLEYLHLLYAILDDTDLLSKVSPRDIECVCSILNRLKSLSLSQEVEIVSFDDLPRDKKFIKAAVERILRHEDMYSLYKKVYLAKEEAVETNLALCSQGKASTLFNDTKEQNGCCRVGQTKMFAKNWPAYQKHAGSIRRSWLQDAQDTCLRKKEVDLHIHMLSTITGAEEIYKGDPGQYKHKDELWIWIPGTEPSIEHLKSFLNAFKASPQAMSCEFEIELPLGNVKLFKSIFTESFIPVPLTEKSQDLQVAILRFKAGTLNSRKAMISPYLPNLIYATV